jgi:hypothetical protein
MAKRFDNWYVSKIDVSLSADGRLQAIESALTRPEGSKSKVEGRRLAAMSLARMKAIGIDNIHLSEPNHKRYSKLLREQNKRNKIRQMTKADVAVILADGQEEEESTA